MNEEDSQKLKQYISSERSRGVSDDVIKTALKEAGWSDEQLAGLFAEAGQRSPESSFSEGGGSGSIHNDVSQFGDKQQSNTPSSSGGSGLKIALVVVVVFLFLGGVGAGAFFAFQAFTGGTENGDVAATQEQKIGSFDIAPGATDLDWGVALSPDYSRFFVGVGRDDIYIPEEWCFECERYDQIVHAQFVPEGNKLAYIGVREDGWYVVFDGEHMGPYRSVDLRWNSQFIISPDNDIAFVVLEEGRQGGATSVILNGEKVGTFTEGRATVLPMLFGENGTFVYKLRGTVEGETGYFVVEDGEFQGGYDNVDNLSFTPTGEVVFIASEGNDEFIVIDGEEVRYHQGEGRIEGPGALGIAPQFHPDDTERFAYAFRKGSREEYLYVDGERHGPFGSVRDYRFSPKGELFYVVEVGEREWVSEGGRNILRGESEVVVYRDHEEIGRHRTTVTSGGIHRIRFSEDGSRYAYLLDRGVGSTDFPRAPSTPSEPGNGEEEEKNVPFEPEIRYALIIDGEIYKEDDTDLSLLFSYSGDRVATYGQKTIESKATERPRSEAPGVLDRGEGGSNAPVKETDADDKKGYTLYWVVDGEHYEAHSSASRNLVFSEDGQHFAFPALSDPIDYSLSEGTGFFAQLEQRSEFYAVLDGERVGEDFVTPNMLYSYIMSGASLPFRFSEDGSELEYVGLRTAETEERAESDTYEVWLVKKELE